MTSEQKVKSQYPKAYVQVYHNRDRSKHWICWLERYNPAGGIRLGLSEKSKQNAWVIAANNLDKHNTK